MPWNVSENERLASSLSQSKCRSPQTFTFSAITISLTSGNFFQLNSPHQTGNKASKNVIKVEIKSEKLSSIPFFKQFYFDLHKWRKAWLPQMFLRDRKWLRDADLFLGFSEINQKYSKSLQEHKMEETGNKLLQYWATNQGNIFTKLAPWLLSLE